MFLSGAIIVQFLLAGCSQPNKNTFKPAKMYNVEEKPAVKKTSR